MSGSFGQKCSLVWRFLGLLGDNLLAPANRDPAIQCHQLLRFARGGTNCDGCLKDFDSPLCLDHCLATSRIKGERNLQVACLWLDRVFCFFARRRSAIFGLAYAVRARLVFFYRGLSHSG